MAMEAGALRLLSTVVIPVYNGAGVVQRCLDALAQQTVAADSFEIIVVDDGSADATAAVVQSWAERHPHLRTRLVQQANAGPAAARNCGAQLAQAPIVLFTDADCAPAPGWVQALLAACADPTVAGAKGVYRTDQCELVARFVQAEYEDRYDRMAGRPQIDFVDTYSAAYRRDIFLANGGFDSTFPTASVEDQEFSFRLASRGHRLVFVPEAAVIHLHDRTLREYARRKFLIGYWKARVTQRHPDRLMQDSHTPQVLKIQILLVALILVALPGLLLRRGGTAPLLAGLGLSFLATTAPFVRKLARRSTALALSGPFLVGVRAVALGCGFALGVVRFGAKIPMALERSNVASLER